jgi:hypothetical protein
MAKFLPLPDGTKLRVPEGMSDDDAMRRARQAFPDIFPKQGGLSGALGKGFESTLSSMRTGLGAILNPEEAAKAGNVCAGMSAGEVATQNPTA